MWNRVLFAVAAVLLLAAVVVAQRTDVFVAPFDHPGIAYTSTPPTDLVARLNRRVADGEVTLAFDPETGYLRSVLEALNVRPESQALVFSPTSFQAKLISMDNPRALYFNDAVAVGFVRGAPDLEFAALDPRQGVVFYALAQTSGSKPEFVRSGECLICHVSDEYTSGIPGYLLLSTLPRPNEDAYAGGFATNYRSLFSERWSGWYVTGDPGAPHLGNRPVSPGDLTRKPLTTPGHPLSSLEGAVDLKGYLTPYSDVVALMVLAHQTLMSNLLTRLGWEARVADTSATAQARVRGAAADVVDSLLFVGEAPLTAPVQGSSGFAAAFSAQGPRDDKGRSLRELDLRRRLMRYPCSYMIYSETFDALPPQAIVAVYARLRRVLSGLEPGSKYRSLSLVDRKAVIEILTATKPEFAASMPSRAR